jgi:hypothetical protein
MKFILRDDDINYHYTKNQLLSWYDGVLEYCPVSICIPAFIKGDFFKWVQIFESHIPYSDEDWLADNQIHGIGENEELVNYIKDLLAQRKATISMHGIIHRNEEMEIPPVENNFIRGAEFYTNKDYTDYIRDAKEYLDNLFGVDVCSFSPPQNMINLNGLKAIKANNLSLCADLLRSPRPKHFINECKFYGFKGTVKVLWYRFVLGHQYPYVLKNGISFIGHQRLQPGCSIKEIKSAFDYCYNKNGVFVLSTHSYGFDHIMKYDHCTMKEALIDILKYAHSFNDVEYSTLHDLFQKER